MGLIIPAGNKAYPVILRLIIWSLLKLLTLATEDDGFSALKDTFKFILQCPHRVYTNLFPARPTWWLVFMLILLNWVDWEGFEIAQPRQPGDGEDHRIWRSTTHRRLSTGVLVMDRK